MDINEYKSNFESLRDMIIFSTWKSIEALLSSLPEKGEIKKKELELSLNFNKNKFLNIVKDAKIMKLVSNGGKAVRLTDFGKEFKENPSSGNKRKALISVPLFSFCFKVFPTETERVILEKWFDEHASSYHAFRGMIVERYMNIYNYDTNGKLPFQFTNYTNSIKPEIKEQIKSHINPDIESWKILLLNGSLTKEQVIEIIFNKYPQEKREEMFKHLLLEKL